MAKTFTYLIVSFFISNSIVAQNSDDLYRKSYELFSDGKYKKALPLIDKALKETPKKSKLYALKGQILYEINNDANEFFSYLSKGVEVEPESPAPLIERGYYYEQIGQYPNAILDYNDALKVTNVDSTKVLIYTNLGGAYQKIQKPKIGHDNLMKGYNLDSNNIGILNNLAMCLDDLNRRNDSKKCLLKVIEIDSTFFGAYVNLGFQASLNQEYELALKYLNKANQLQPEQAFALNNRGHVKLKLNDIDGALKDINQSIKLDPNNSYAYLNRALVYIEKKNVEKSCEDLYLAKKLGFSIYYGPEVDELIKEKCIK
jgi:tetratricopeptide (TPR) repeat protein